MGTGVTPYGWVFDMFRATTVVVVAWFVGHALNEACWVWFWADAPFPRQWRSRPPFSWMFSYPHLDVFLAILSPVIQFCGTFAAIRLNVRPIVFLSAMLATPFFLVGVLCAVDSRTPAEIFGFLVFNFAFVALMGTMFVLIQFESRLQSNSAASGVAANPFKMWLILAYSLIALILVPGLARHLGSQIWDMLNTRFDAWTWHPRIDAPFQLRYSDHGELVTKFLVQGFAFYVFPYLLLLLSLKLNLRPWMGIFLGFFEASIVLGYYWIFQNYDSLHRLTEGLVFAQLTTAITFSALWLYHSKIQPVHDELESD